MSSGSARDLRLSDAERELAVSDLKEHCAAGRLTLEELPDRVASVYRATTYGELAEAMAGLPDLPSVPSSPPARRKSRRPWFPGRAPFLQTLEVVQPPEDVLAKALKNVAPSLTRFGFEIAVIERDRIIFERSLRPAWTFLVALITFPIGLLALLIKDREQLTVAVEGLGDGGTRLTVHGRGPLQVRRAVAELGSG